MTALELSMFRRGDMLVPSAEMFREDLHAVVEGKEVMVRVWMARNPKQDRWFWAMLTELVSSGVFDGTKEALHRHLKIALGLADPEIGEDGKTYWVLRSTSPASMDKLTFTAHIRNIEQYVAERWGTDINELRKAVRSKAGADAEPKWNQEPETAGTPPVESEGEVAGGPDAVPGVDDATSPIASAPRLATATKPATDTAPHLILVDGTGLAFRFWYGAPKSANRETGEEVGAITGFCRELWRLRREPVSHIGVIFDHPGRNWRHELYPEYKSNRKEKEEGLRAFLNQAREATEAFALASPDYSGFEADDVIATATRAGAAMRLEVTVYSQDKDLLALCQPGVMVVVSRSKGESGSIDKRYDEAAVFAKLGVRPQQMPDFLALAGDTSDGIPGIDGIGPKGAAELLAQFGSLDGIIRSNGFVPKARKVQSAAVTAILYRQLAELRTCADPFNAETLAVQPFKRAAVAEFLRRIDAPSLLREIRETGLA